MTALAMIIGMLPMSLGLGEGGEQNAPLGRAVIGGLLVATFSTLFFVPVVYSALRQRAREARVEARIARLTDQLRCMTCRTETHPSTEGAMRDGADTAGKRGSHHRFTNAARRPAHRARRRPSPVGPRDLLQSPGRPDRPIGHGQRTARPGSLGHARRRTSRASR